MRLLILGASGQLGNQLAAEARKLGPPNVVATASRGGRVPIRFDLAEPSTVAEAIEMVRPTHIILSAAATNVAWSETHPEEAARINLGGVSAVVNAARQLHAAVAFISSDYVFDGTDGPYDEAEEPSPINEYGRQKAAAERIVLDLNRGLVVRTCQVFGPDERRRNYVLRLADALARGETVSAAADLWGTPTYAPELARSIVGLASQGAIGVWHRAGPDFLSRADLARAVAVAFRLPADLIIPSTAAKLHDGVPRPKLSGLKTIRPLAQTEAQMRPLDMTLNELAVWDGTK